MSGDVKGLETLRTCALLLLVKNTNKGGGGIVEGKMYIGC